MRKYYSIFLCLLLVLQAGAQEREVKLKLIETSDVHGNYSSYDFMLRQASEGGLPRVQTYLTQERRKYGDNLILLD